MDNNKESPDDRGEDQEEEDEIMNPIFKWDFYGFVCMIIAAWIMIIPVSNLFGGSDFVFWALVLFNLYLSLWLWRRARTYIVSKSYETGIPIYLPVTDEQKKKHEERKRKREEAQRRDERALRVIIGVAIAIAVLVVVMEFRNEGFMDFINLFR